jgi:hypothetical protein
MTHVLKFGASPRISIFRVDLFSSEDSAELIRRYPVGRLHKKGEMPEWLKKNADHESIYELWVCEKIASRWTYGLEGRFKRL